MLKKEKQRAQEAAKQGGGGPYVGSSSFSHDDRQQSSANGTTASEEDLPYGRHQARGIGQSQNSYSSKGPPSDSEERRTESEIQLTHRPKSARRILGGIKRLNILWILKYLFTFLNSSTSANISSLQYCTYRSKNPNNGSPKTLSQQLPQINS